MDIRTHILAKERPTLSTNNPLHLVSRNSPYMGTADVDEVEPLPTLGWVEGSSFTALDNITLKSFMDSPVRSWEDDFTDVDRERYTNLKCLLPCGRMVPGLVPIVREFDINWTSHWRSSVWEDGRRCFRVENVVESDGLVEAFDIDPTPAPSFNPHPALVTSSPMETVQYGGWTDASYVHVLPPGSAGAKVNVTAMVVEQLDGVAYNVQLTTTTSTRGLPQGVPLATHEEVRICTWNCRGIPRATFRPNLYTLRTMTHSNVVVLTEIRASELNVRHLLCQAHGLN